MSSQVQVHRFYRSNLSTVVWDAENNKILAEFINGQFYTSDERVIEILSKLGYPEVSLDAENPPDIVFEKGRSLANGEHASILPKGVNENVALENEKKRAEQERLIKQANEQSQPDQNHFEKSPSQITLENKANGNDSQSEVNDITEKASNIAKAVLSEGKVRKIKRRKKG